MTVLVPTLVDSTEVLLCRGLMALLVEAGLVNFQESGAYGDTYPGPAGFIASFPAMPDRVLAMTPYTVGDDAAEPMSTIGVQVRTRWAGSSVRHVLNYSAAIFGALHGLGPLTLTTGVSISQVLRQSSGTLGQEPSGAKRWAWADNYYVDLDRPTMHRAGS